MKIWPFDIAAERTGGWNISPAELEAALEPFAKIRKAVGDRMDIMVEFHSLWSLPMAQRLAQALAPFGTYWHETRFASTTLPTLRPMPRTRRPGYAPPRPWPILTPSVSISRPALPASQCSTSPVRGPLRGAQDRRPRRGMARSRGTARLHRSGGLRRFVPLLAARTPTR